MLRQKQNLLTVLVALITFVSAPVSMADAPDFPEPIADDNGHHAFVREVVPILLGRKPRGALEIKLLADIADLEGRAAMVLALTSRDEYLDHWSSVLLDVVQLQRGGQRSQASACYNNPERTNSDGEPVVSTSLAAQLRNRSPDGEPLLNGADFNMQDVLRSALKRDDLSVVMRSYLMSLGVRPGRASGTRGRENIGQAFSHVYLNRNFGCMGCHNEVSAVTDESSGWNRAFPIGIALDEATLGSSAGTSNANVFNLFRQDVKVDQLENGSADPDAIMPWGIEPSCVQDTRDDTIGLQDVSANGGLAVDFAGISGTGKSIFDLESTLADGVTRIAAEGLLVEDDGSGLPAPANPDAALAFQVAAAVVDEVWLRVYGKRLTINNYFPRNAAQRDALWNLTESVFLPDWSLRAVLVAMLTSGYTDRRSPDSSLHDHPYQLPMIIDPWVARDPRQPDSDFDDPSDPALYHNGQGEIVRRHETATLFRLVSHALDWPETKPYGNSPYPSSSLMRDVGQYWSQNEPGHRGLDLQSMLAWEESHGACRYSPSQSDDWINKLIDEVDAFNAANPLQPMLLQDVVETVKDWLIQEADISVAAPQGGDLSELEALAALLAGAGNLPIPLTTPVTALTQNLSSDEWELRVRRVCGALLQSPQFMLKGISPRGPLRFPKLRVCHDDEECSYEQMCEGFRPLLASHGHHIECLAGEVVPGEPPPSIGPIVDVCGPNDPRCTILERPLCLDELVPRRWGAVGGINVRDCPIDTPRCDPRCVSGGLGGFGLGAGFGGRLDVLGGGELGLICCGGRSPDFERADPGAILGWLEDATVVDPGGALVYPLGSDRIAELRPGATLAFGDVVMVPQDSGFQVKSRDGWTFGFGKEVTTAADGYRPSKLDLEMAKFIEAEEPDGVEKLLRAGANPNAVLTGGWSAVTRATALNDRRTVGTLVRYGADINRRDRRGNLPVQLVSSRSRMGRLLRELGSVQRPGGDARKEPLPRFVFVTGPSAAKAAHRGGDRYLQRGPGSGRTRQTPAIAGRPDDQGSTGNHAQVWTLRCGAQI